MLWLDLGESLSHRKSLLLAHPFTFFSYCLFEASPVGLFRIIFDNEMQVKRQFCYITMIGLLIVLSVAVLVSVSEFLSFLSHKEWLSESHELTKRQTTFNFTIPWT